MGLVQKSFSDIITFSRSSNATRVGPTGVLEYAPHNLLTYSEQFDNAAWTKSNTTVTANAAAAPNGTVTADLVTANTSSSFGFLYSNNTASGVFTASVYAKQGTQRYIQFLSTATAAYWANFDLQDGLAYAGGTTSSVSIVSVGNGWYRCSMSVTDSSANPHVIGFAASLNSARAPSTTLTTNFYLWGAQLSVGPYALDYVPTTSAAVYGPRFDYDGSGVTIVEPVSRNLLLYSQEFDNAAWTTFLSKVSVTANTVISPDGTTNADTMTGDGTSGAHYIVQVLAGVGSGKTLSFYAKAGTNNFIQVFTDFTSNEWANFDVATGATGSKGSNTGATTITAVGNGWYRCTMVTGDASSQNISFALISSNTAGRAQSNTLSTSVYLWGAQLEVGSTATAYMVSGATNGFRAVPVVSGSATARGLLVEEQRVNSMTYSDDLSNAAWSKSGATVSANFAATPDGQVTADKIVENSATSNHEVFQSVSITSGTTYTLSFFAKAAGRDYVACTHNGTSSYASSYFNLANGTVVSSGSGHTTSIQSFGNGWYRVTSTFTAGVTASIAFEILASDNGSRTSYAGDGSSGILVWGAQLEAGSFATSLIPTLASTVTRSADVASVNTLSPWFNNTEFSAYYEFQTFGLIAGVTAPYPAEFGDGTANNRVVSYLSNTDAVLYITSGGVLQAMVAESGAANNVILKQAIAVKQNSFANVLNGTTPSTSSSGTVPTVTTLTIGKYPLSSDNFLNGWMRRIAVYPRRLTNAELQALTA